ncbi:MAG: NADH-quinone oxidoreductase subunit A [Coriobacteriia bacterium]
MPVGSDGVLYLVGLSGAAVLFVLLVLGANALLSPRLPTELKREPYECGMPPAGRPWAPVHLRYTTLAVLLVIFDAESALLFGIASGLRGSPVAVLQAGVFVAALAFGLWYAWRKGCLAWRS